MPKPIPFKRNGITHWRSGIKCPICKTGWETTTPRPNLLNHVKAIARNELLAKFLTGVGKTPHADWLKKNVIEEVEYNRMFTIKMKGRKYGFKL